ncbi:Os08g0546000, partial [Oryza sativa Japonica Group]
MIAFDDDVAIANDDAGDGAGDLARAGGLLVPVGAPHGEQHQRRAHQLRGEHAGPHAAEVEARRPERQRQGGGHADAVERRDVDPRRPPRPRAAAQHTAADRLRAVPQLGGAEDGQRRRRQPQDGGVGGEHPRPHPSQGRRERARHDAERGAAGEPDAGGEARALRPPRAELVPDARRHGAAEGVREDVQQRRGLDQYPHRRHRRLRVGEHAAEQHHDLVPPPLQAHRHAAVGPDGGERDAADPEAEAVHEEDVDGDVERERGGGGVRERERDGLRAEVHAERVEEGLHGEVRERAEDELVGAGGNVGVLAGGDEDPVHGEPERGDGHGRGEEQHDRSPERGGEHGRAAGAERLAAHGVHPGGEPGQHRVPGDVGEAEREGAAGERETAKPAKKEHGYQRAHVHQQPSSNHRHGEPHDGCHLGDRAAAAARRPGAVMQGGACLRWREQRLV